MSELMTTHEVAELLRRPVETLRYWRWRGEGPPSFKIGARVLYRRVAVLAWLAERERTTTTA